MEEIADSSETASAAGQPVVLVTLRNWATVVSRVRGREVERRWAELLKGRAGTNLGRPG